MHNAMSTSTLIKFPVFSFRRITSPYDDEHKTSYAAVVNVKYLPEALEDWRGLNVRDPNTSSGVARKIASTLQDGPVSFLYRNRGITLMAAGVEFDNKTNALSIEMNDKRKQGLLDGGHTYRVIREFVESMKEEELADFNAYVRLEVLVGITDLDEAVAIVESRNTSSQVQEQSLEELRGGFDAIKSVLDGKPYADRIAYKEYELLEDGSKKDLDIREILSYLLCFDVESYDQQTHPVIAYSTKKAVIEHFKQNRDRLQRLVPLLPKILELRDEIYLALPEAYNSQGGKFGKLTGVIETSHRSRMERSQLPFIGKESSYRIPSGFIYPVLASLRNLVENTGEKRTFKTDPIRFFNDMKKELAGLVGDQAKELRNPNKLGKDNAIWRMCYQAVRVAVLERGL